MGSSLADDRCGRDILTRVTGGLELPLVHGAKASRPHSPIQHPHPDPIPPPLQIRHPWAGADEGGGGAGIGGAERPAVGAGAAPARPPEGPGPAFEALTLSLARARRRRRAQCSRRPDREGGGGRLSRPAPLHRPRPFRSHKPTSRWRGGADA